MTKVLWLETEAFQAGLKDRINALGIPKDRVLFPFKNPLEDVRLDDENHRGQIERVIREAKPSLVVVDSLRGSHQREENDSGAMTKILSFLARLARDHRVAVLVIHHVRKPAAGQPDIITLNRQRGSSATAYLSRTVWGLEQPDPTNQALRLRIIKSNVAGIPEPLGLKTTDTGIEWTGEVPQQPKTKSKVDEAEEFLRKTLVDRPRPYKELVEKADQEDIQKSSLKRAAKRLGVTKEKKGDHWEWTLKKGKATFRPSEATGEEE